MRRPTILPTGDRPAQRFDSGHPLYGPAADRCASRHGQRFPCGPCWDAVIRADAVVAAECGLPPDPPAPDPAYVDPVVITRCLAMDRPERITPAERDAFLTTVTDRGWELRDIADALRVPIPTVMGWLADLVETWEPERGVA